VKDLNSNEVEVNNYPNPFTNHTTFDLYLPTASDVELEIYSLSGQKIQTLINGQLTAGLQTVCWFGDNSQGSKVNSGIYFYRLRIGDFEVIKKLILMDE